MTSQNHGETQNRTHGTPVTLSRIDKAPGKDLPLSKSEITERLEKIESLPHRHPLLHWGAFVLSILSFAMLLIWVINRGPVPRNWILLDIGFGVVFAIEFFTRSGFRWGKGGYLRTRFFDFIAIVPALALVNHGFRLEEWWVWLILLTRTARVIDRFLGDGFVKRNILALVEGFEEEITDRVLERIIARLQADMDKAGFSHGVAAVLIRNKSSILERVRAETPREGLVPSLARVVGLDLVLERAEERTYDAMVGIIDSEEVDRAVRESVNSTFENILKELGKQDWKKHLGIQRRT